MINGGSVSSVFRLIIVSAAGDIPLPTHSRSFQFFLVTEAAQEPWNVERSVFHSETGARFNAARTEARWFSKNREAKCCNSLTWRFTVHMQHVRLPPALVFFCFFFYRNGWMLYRVGDLLEHYPALSFARLGPLVE